VSCCEIHPLRDDELVLDPLFLDLRFVMISIYLRNENVNGGWIFLLEGSLGFIFLEWKRREMVCIFVKEL
jgi:hypothetical protein